MKVIARIHNAYDEKFGVPRQSGLAEEVVSTIVFEEEYRVDEALRGIEEFSHLNNDNEYIRNYRINNRCKVVRVATENEADLTASNIRYSKDGSTFTVRIDGKNHKFTTSLLGKHNITNLLLGIAIGYVTYLSHQVHAVGNHDKYHTHVLGKRQQQVAEILALDDRVLLVQFLNATQSMLNAGHRLAIVALYV